MPTHLALLRGINVGRGPRVGMPRLREVVTALGHTEVATLLQSGNLVLTPAGDPAPQPTALADQLRAAVRTEFDVDPPVLVLTAQEWDELLADLPFAQPADPTTVHAFVLPAPFTAQQLRAVDELGASTSTDDEVQVRGRVAWLHTPGGLGRSALAERLTRSRQTGMQQATARNWRTATRVQELLRG